MVMSPKRTHVKPENICLLALGTGRVLHYNSDPNHDWGYVQWVPKLTNAIWDGMIVKSQILCEELLGERYYKVDPVLQEEIPMDDPAQIPVLTEIAKKQDLSGVEQWIQKQIFPELESVKDTKEL
jgi:hypothetical protein